jgi:hypothetical protein
MLILQTEGIARNIVSSFGNGILNHQALTSSNFISRMISRIYTNNLLFLLIACSSLYLFQQVELFAQPKSQNKPTLQKVDITGSTSRDQTIAQFVRMYLNYPADHEFSYVYTDSTEVERLYSDSSKLAYKRYVKYFITQRAMKDARGKDVEVECNIDSMEYSFSSGESTISFTSKDKGKLAFPDLLAANFPENRSFTIQYSPYNEVANVYGEQLDYWREYDEKYGAGQDTMIRYIFLNSISNENLAHFGDIQHGIFPVGKVAKDSTWKKPYFMRVDGVNCRDDSAKSKITSYSNGLYTINTIANNLIMPPTKRVRLYNIPFLVEVLGGQGNSQHTIEFTNRNFIKSSSAVVNLMMKARANNEVFTQKVRTHYRWDLKTIYK